VPATSTAVHGISTEMLAGRPPIEAVLPSFAAFAADTVLVGHNIGFDLAFLRRVEQRAGVRFEHPALDTLLLSTVVHPDATEHSLDAVAARLGVDVLGRHTALGDALVTAEVFVRLLRLLSAQGVTTLEQATALTQRTAHARASSYDRDTTAGAPDARNLPAM
jgi:DNA polymerase-3 subunit epsilon